MGMYDIVWVPCPKCGTKHECQSKSGPSGLEEFEMDAAPLQVMAGINDLSPYRCQECGSYFKVEIQTIYTAVQVGRPVAEEHGRIPYRKRDPRRHHDP